MRSWSEAASDLSPRCPIQIMRQIVGLLLFIAKTRLDILYVVAILTSRVHCCTELDLELALHCCAYLCYTRDMEYTFLRGTPEARQNLTIIAAADSATGGHPSTSQAHYGRAMKIVTDLQTGMHCGSASFFALSLIHI